MDGNEAVVTALVPGKFTVKMPISAVRAEVTVGGHTYTYKETGILVGLEQGRRSDGVFLLMIRTRRTEDVLDRRTKRTERTKSQ